LSDSVASANWKFRKGDRNLKSRLLETSEIPAPEGSLTLDD